MLINLVQVDDTPKILVPICTCGFPVGNPLSGKICYGYNRNVNTPNHLHANYHKDDL